MASFDRGSSSQMPQVNGDVLRWARETAGLTVEEAAHRLALGGPAGVERLRQMEVGEREPTRTQLVNMSEKYRRPLLTFYLPRPPRPAGETPDFRQIPNPERGSEAILDALVRNVKVRQTLIQDALEEAEEAEPLPFVASINLRDGVQATVEALERLLGIGRREFRAERTIDAAFKVLRDATERAGIYVLLMGNLGSHHTDLPPDVFRGFAIADRVAPLIVINEKDARAAWSFTLLHELVHVGLGATGISGYGSQSQVERFCDDVSAAFLLAPAELNELAPQRAPNLDALIADIGVFARPRKLSRKMVAYNLMRRGDITPATYQQICDRLDADRAAQHRQGGPVDYYVVRRHRIGPGLISVVNRLVASGGLTSTKAARVLGIKPTAIGRLVGDMLA